MTQIGQDAFCERLLTQPPSIFGYSGPRDSGPCAFLDRKNNVWIDDNGVVLKDLREMGFSAWMRQTILMYIHQHEEDHCVVLINDWGDSIELFW